VDYKFNRQQKEYSRIYSLLVKILEAYLILLGLLHLLHLLGLLHLSLE
jgi:hypothetical protein